MSTHVSGFHLSGILYQFVLGKLANSSIRVMLLVLFIGKQ